MYLKKYHKMLQKYHKYEYYNNYLYTNQYIYCLKKNDIKLYIYIY